MKDLLLDLELNKDLKYRDFNARLMPNVNKDLIIGVRIPILRRISKKYFTVKKEFFNELPHKYFEENMIHAFMIEQVKDFNECINLLNDFLPYIDNWQTCDCLSPKIFKQDLNQLLSNIKIWINDKHIYTRRFAILMLKKYFLDKLFNQEYLDLVISAYSKDYYIEMMISWYFSEALIKQYKSTIKYIESNSLPVWVHNKTIQKAIESYRIDNNTKEYLKTLRIKKAFK